MSLALDGKIESAYIGDKALNAIYLGKDLFYTAEVTPDTQPEPYLPYEYFYFKASTATAQVSFSEEIRTSTTGGTTPITVDRTQFTNYVIPTFEYSYDKTNWENYTLGTIITLKRNSKSTVYFRGNNIKPWYDKYTTDYKETVGDSTSTFTHFHCIWINANVVHGMVKSGGNVLSLRDSLLSDITTIPCEYAFSGLFFNCAGLITAPVLSATKLKNYCYGGGSYIYIDLVDTGLLGMFRGCTSLITPPSLPATTLAEYCYDGMFYDSGITEAPTLSATTLATGCYENMFRKCTSLTTPPVLSATTLANWCYEGMFAYSGITKTPKLPATTVTESCYGSWVGNGMFEQCKNLTSITTLPALTIGSTNAYYGMFRGSNVKASATQTAECKYAYRVPTSGTGTADSKSLTSMFASASDSGSFTPSINTTFYINVPSF